MAAGGGGGGAVILVASSGVVFSGTGYLGNGSGAIYGAFTNNGSFPDGTPAVNSYSSFDSANASVIGGGGGGGEGGAGQAPQAGGNGPSLSPPVSGHVRPGTVTVVPNGSNPAGGTLPGANPGSTVHATATSKPNTPPPFIPAGGWSGGGTFRPSVPAAGPSHPALASGQGAPSVLLLENSSAGWPRHAQSGVESLSSLFTTFPGGSAIPGDLGSLP